MLGAPLLCLLAATAEAAEARQVANALRATPPQLVVRHVAAQLAPGASAQQTGQPDTAAGSAVSLDTGQQHSRAADSATAAEAALAASVAAFSPQLSVPLTLGLQYTNSGVLTALCLFWTAVLWPR